MVETNELQIGIGTEEAVTLKPARVKIVSVSIELVGVKNSHKVICVCKHPVAEETIKISAVKYENKSNLEFSGLWINKDSQGLIKKGSALAVFLTKLGCATIEQLKDKEVDTTEDEKKYLVFKAY